TIGPLRKKLRVLGDRVWKAGFLGPKLGDPQPFSQMPLIYERTFGGQHGDPPQSDPRNPVGRGFVTRKADLPDTLAPNIEDPSDKTRPAGLGPIAPNWSPRCDRAGPYDAAWHEQRKPLVPADFDDRFFQAAPDDQQVPGYLSGGEEVELINV